MEVSVRTLPMRVEPVAGEALDSWVEAVSHRISSAWGDVVEAIGLPAPNGMGGTPWLTHLTPAEAAGISAATGLKPAQLHTMTLARYDGAGLRIRQDTRTVDRAFPWSRMRLSRFCPDCLRDSGGRWQLYWRLGWAFACEEHRCLLVDECPNCGQRQRERSFPADLTPKPGHCALPASGATGRAGQRCGADLSAAPVDRLPDGHPTLSAQRTIREVIDTGIGVFGIYRDQPMPSMRVLADIRAVAGRVLAYASDDDLRRVLPADLHRAYRQLKMRTDSVGAAALPDDKPGLAAPAHAITAAVGVTAALGIVDSADVASAGDALRWLVTGARSSGLAVNTSNIGWGRGTTAPLTAAQLVALAPHLTPSDQLRYRIGTAMPTRPSHDDAEIAAMIEKLPAALWPAWTLRLATPRQDYQYLSTALPCAVLLVNTRLSLTQASEAMGRNLDGHSLSHTLQQLEADPQWNHIRDAIIRLADYLHSHDCPIDYRRRRTLDYNSLLTPQTWQRICGEVNIRSGGDKKARLARCHLYATVSGNPARYAPWFLDSNDFSVASANFPVLLTPALAAALNTEAQRFLDEVGIDEPVIWEPPRHLLAGLTLPGANFKDIDPTLLHQLVRQPLALSNIAERLDSTLDAVRYALTLRPAPEHRRGPTCGPSPALTALAGALSGSTLTGLYHGQKLSLKEIGARYGVERKVVARLARQYGIALRAPQRPHQYEEVDRDWLYTEYVVNSRALPDLAAEKGMSTMNMSRWAKVHGIALRGRGGPSHTASINAAKAAQDAPKVLRPVLVEIGGAERLSRFVAASGFPTVTAAAKTLGLCQPVLQGQITRLEKTLGGRLLDRAERGHPMAVTDLGGRVIDAWATWNSGRRVPDPIATDDTERVRQRRSTR